jgi:hypothetical protein
MTTRARALLAALALVLAAGHAGAQTALPIDVSVADDADHFAALRLRSGALFDYASPFRYTGVAAQTTHYTQSGWHSDAPAFLLLWRNQRRDTLAGTIAEAGLVRIAGRTRLIGDATWSLRPNERTGIEFLGSADLVETPRALDRATAYAFLAMSAERQLTGRFTVIGLAGYQRFTDGNARLHLRGRVIWMLVPEQGLSAQLRYRQYDNRQLDVDGAYFNPAHYREMQGGLAIRKRYAGWIWSGTVAAGREEIDSDVHHATALVDFRTEGVLGGRTRLVIHASYNRSAGYVAADGYWYRIVGVNVVVPF